MSELAQEVLAGEEAWVVGGAIRDELLRRPIVDLDVACREPERTARTYARRSAGAPFPLSERHGAWRVALDDGRTVDFTPLRGSLEDDLATRDFTINAIAIPLGGGDAADPFGGRADLERGVVRAVGDADARMREDRLRALRAIRFAARFGFEIDGATWSAIVTRAPTAISRSSSTANESIETAPTTRRRSPPTSTSVPVRSRRKPSAYPTGTMPIQVGASATKRRP